MTAVMKRSHGKATDPGVHQVWLTDGGLIIGLAGERLPGTPLLEPVIRQGRPVRAPLELDIIRQQCAANRAALPAAVIAFEEPQPLQVTRSAALRDLQASLVKATAPV
jgi:nicotinate phosphoribosyltransferase